MIKRIALLAIVFLLNLSSPALAADPGNGVIEGQLVNGTAGGGSIAGQAVILTIYLNGGETGNSSAKTGADGKFVFSGLSTASGNSYDVKLKYQEADYTSKRLSLADNETTKSTTLTVYDSTGSDSAISITAAHTIVYLVDGNLEIVEYLVFTNASDRSYIGSGEITATGGKRTLKLPLPAEATELQYGGDLITGRVLPDANGLVDTTAVLPGDKLIAYGYKIGYDSGSYKFSQKIDYPIASYNFLVQGENTTATSAQLSAGQIVDFQGLKFISLSGGNLARGETLNVQLSSLSRAGLPQRDKQQNTIVVMLGLLVVLGVGGGFIYLMKRKNRQMVSLENSPEQLRRRLLLDIAGLDDDFESGKLEKETYTKLRAERKSQLVELMQGSKEESGRG